MSTTHTPSVKHYRMNASLLEQVARWDRMRAVVLEKWSKRASDFGVLLEDLRTEDGWVTGLLDLDVDMCGFEDLPRMPNSEALGEVLGVGVARVIHTPAGTLVTADGLISGAVDVSEKELAEVYHIHTYAGKCEACGLMRGGIESECGRCGNKF